MNSYKSKSLVGTILVSGLFLGLCYVMLRFVPNAENVGIFNSNVFANERNLVNSVSSTPFSTYSLTQQSLSAVAVTEDLELSGLDFLLGFETGIEKSFGEESSSKEDVLAEEDSALLLYRQTLSRPAVEWFYTHVTGNREIAQAILKNAAKNDIPPSLAFALAYVESNYKTNAVNKNKNKTIDRGLFQLNEASFPQLSEADFFNPNINAKYGMTHLKYCLDVAGNEITALAMYNAGTTKVKNNNTPQHTLNYVAKISKYRRSLDKQFASEVASFYKADSNAENAIAMAR